MRIEIEALDFAFDFIRSPTFVKSRAEPDEDWKVSSEREDSKSSYDGETYGLETLSSTRAFTYSVVNLPPPLDTVRLFIPRQGPIYSAYFILAARQKGCFQDISRKFRDKLRQVGLEFINYDSAKLEGSGMQPIRRKRILLNSPVTGMTFIGVASDSLEGALGSNLRDLTEEETPDNLGGVGLVFESGEEKPCYSIMDLPGNARRLGMGCGAAYPRRFQQENLEFRKFDEWVEDFKDPQIGFEALLNTYLACCYMKDPLPGKVLSMTP